jgi:hypothetical protein
MATTLQYNRKADAFKVANEGRVRFVPRDLFFEKFVDQDLLDTAALAIVSENEVIAVSNQTCARGVRNPRGECQGVIL